MCRTTPSSMPFTAFANDDGSCIGVRSDSVRHLALIDIEGARYTQLPLRNKTLFDDLHCIAQERKHRLENEIELIAEAQQRLSDFASSSEHGYAIFAS